MRCFKEDILHLNRWNWTIYLWQPTDHQKGIWCCSLHTAGWCNQWFWYLCVVLFCFESSRKVTKMTKFWYFGRLASNESQNLLEIKEQHWIFPKKWNFVQIIVMCCAVYTTKTSTLVYEDKSSWWFGLIIIQIWITPPLLSLSALAHHVLLE